MEIMVRGVEAAAAEEHAVSLVWAYHMALHEGLGEEEVARRRAAYVAFAEGLGYEPLGE